jgi:RHS repeat-associated protein
MYFHTDLNGAPEELTDENGKILWECSFQLWGKRIHEIEHEPIEQNLRYQGQYLDRETGLHYNTFRYYDPDIGRFTQPDPIGLLGGFNLYQYAPNGLTWIDPWGLMSCKPNHKAGMSSKKYGHARNRHGSQNSTQSMMDRTKTTGKPQGHFSDNRMIEEAFNKAPSTPGSYDVKVSQPSKVYYPDGTVKTTDIVKVVISENKGPVTAYPYILGD